LTNQRKRELLGIYACSTHAGRYLSTVGRQSTATEVVPAYIRTHGNNRTLGRRTDASMNMHCVCILVPAQTPLAGVVEHWQPIQILCAPMHLHRPYKPLHLSTPSLIRSLPISNTAQCSPTYPGRLSITPQWRQYHAKLAQNDCTRRRAKGFHRRLASQCTASLHAQGTSSRWSRGRSG